MGVHIVDREPEPHVLGWSAGIEFEERAPTIDDK